MFHGITFVSESVRWTGLKIEVCLDSFDLFSLRWVMDHPTQDLREYIAGRDFPLLGYFFGFLVSKNTAPAARNT